MSTTDARARAEKLLQDEPSRPRAICTDPFSKPGTVAIGFALRGVGSCLLTVASAEWNVDWRKNLGILDA